MLMEGIDRDELDHFLIELISKGEKITPLEAHDKVNSVSTRKISRAIVWSRLVNLVESGCIDFVQTDEDKIKKTLIVLPEKT